MLCGDGDAGADVAQEAFVRLWQQRDRYDPRGSLRSYLLRVAHNLCLDRLRGAKHEAPWDECQEQTPAAARDALLAHAIREAVMTLPPTQRAVFVLTEYEGLSYQETAAALEISPGRVASAKHDAVSGLRRRLASLADEEGYGK
jgi:RNA polymerase sigma-70 factor (ECF subfamily)